MNIIDVKPGAANVVVEGIVVEKDAPREVVTKFGKKLRVANATLKDDTGSITLSLWNNDIDSVNQGDRIKITNGYVSEFKGTPQISAGKFGKIEVVEKGAGGSASGSDEMGDESGMDEEEA